MSINIKHINKTFNTQVKCIAFLEKVRWNGKPVSPFTDKSNVTKRKDGFTYHCNDTNKDFTVLHGTIFQDSKYPLPSWFLMITMILNAKTGISAMQLMRNLDCSYKTAWYTAMRIRCAMIDNCIELQNIVEIDEAYVGGKPRKVSKNHEDNKPNIGTVEVNKRGRGTKKTPIIGIVERNGNIVLRVAEKINSKTLLDILKSSVNLKNTIVMSDELPAYNSFDKLVQHLSIDHSKGRFSEGIVHTNTIEGFWSIVKNSIRGNYIAISKKYLPLYLVQAQYIYNRRNSNRDLFSEFIGIAMHKSNCFTNYKPKELVKSIVYKDKKSLKC